jgi:hypothetical protein
MKTVDSPFSQAQFEAARFMVARLRAEACEEPFNSKDIGFKFTEAGELPAAIVDDGTVITVTDFIRASLLMVWSLVMDMAEEEDVTPLEVVQAIGLSLAENDPA